MSYRIEATRNFIREAKPLVKKYPSLRKEIQELEEVLLNDPRHGTSLGNNCYKIRLAITSKGKGKSGGARVITCIVVDRESVYLVSIYDKSEQADITESDLNVLLKAIPVK